MISIHRRGLIAAGLSAAVLPRMVLAAALPAALRFNILRNGKPFGQYQVSFVTAGKQLTATTEVAMSQKIAGLTVFEYSHHCVETWVDGRFAEMQSRTLRDKGRSEDDTVHAVRDGGTIRITTNKGPGFAPENAAPLTHWNAATLSGPLINPQDGQPVDVTARQLGRDPVTLATGAVLTATHWALRGSQTLDEWYDDAGLWAGLRGVLPDRSVIEYRRV